MNRHRIFFSTVVLVCACGASCSASAQGTFVFDQQTSESVDGAILLSRTPFGQSFTPTLDSIDFVELRLNDGATPSTVAINIRSGSITGLLLGTSMPTTLPSFSGGVSDFLFSDSIALTPGTKYYFEPVVVSGGYATSEVTFIDYTGGDQIYDGAVQRGDLWFREGVISSVPEPSSEALWLMAGTILLWRSHKSATAKFEV